MPSHRDFDDDESARMPFDPLRPREGESIDARVDEILLRLRAGSASRGRLREQFGDLAQRVTSIEDWQRRIDAGQLETLAKLRENTAKTEAAAHLAGEVKNDTKQIVQFTTDLSGFVRIAGVITKFFSKAVWLGLPSGIGLLALKYGNRFIDWLASFWPK